MLTVSESLLSPPELGMPERFSHWRPTQISAILRGMDAHTRVRFVAQSLPTGAGKSIVALAQALLTGRRVVYLTATKGLQDQLVRDFGSDEPGMGIGLVDLRGKNSYPCPQSDYGVGCEDGPCMGGLRNKLAGTNHDCMYGAVDKCKCVCQCPAKAAVELAKRSQFVVTNYHMWMAINRYGEGLGKVDLLVCDEAHDAVNILSDTLTVTISDLTLVMAFRAIDKPPAAPTVTVIPPDSLRGKPFELQYVNQEWRTWARTSLLLLEGYWQQLQLQAKETGNTDAYKQFKKMQTLWHQLKEIAGGRDGEWIMERNREKGGGCWEFNPIWPKEYAERWLFCGVEKVLLMSATIRPKTLELLGITGERTL